MVAKYIETESDQWGSCHEHSIRQVVPSPGSCSMFLRLPSCKTEAHIALLHGTLNTQYCLHHDRHSKAQTGTLLVLSIKSLSRMNVIKKMGEKTESMVRKFTRQVQFQQICEYAEWLREQQKLCISMKEMVSWCLRHRWDQFSGQMGS